MAVPDIMPSRRDCGALFPRRAASSGTKHIQPSIPRALEKRDTEKSIPDPAARIWLPVGLVIRIFLMRGGEIAGSRRFVAFA